jgi:hypothetical protein
MGEPNDELSLRGLRQYVDMRFAEQKEAVSAALTAADKAVNAALLAADRAVAKAEVATDKRFEGVNEFRAALADNARLMMPRAEAERAFAALGEKVDAVTKVLASNADRGIGLHQGWLLLIGIIGIIEAVVMVFYYISIKGH